MTPSFFFVFLIQKKTIDKKMELAALCSAVLPDVDAVKQVIQNYSELSKMWKGVPLAAKDTYERHCVGASDSCEIYIIAWGAGADSGYHPHPEVGCWMTVLIGELWELGVSEHRKLQAGDFGFRRGGGADGCHRIVAHDPAFSLHVYAPRALKKGGDTKGFIPSANLGDFVGHPDTL